MNDRLRESIELLNPEQKAAVVHGNSPLLILAGAGSGKTRVITTKIAYLINECHVAPEAVLSVTFTKKAADEMRTRAVALERSASASQIRTFHSFGAWFLRRYAEAAGVEPSFTVYDDDDMAALVKKAVPSLSTREANLAARQISLAKDYCLFPEDDLSEIAGELDLPEIYSAYEKRLRATGNVDFGDLIMLPVRVMDSNPHIAGSIHSRFSVIMVDEYQDSNIAQFRLLDRISGAGDKSGAYVCVVGDDDQSIYKFRGAEVRNILEFPEHFPGTQIIRLERNYRSTAGILNAAGLVVANNSGRLGKTLSAARGDGGTPVLAFVPDQEAEAVFVSELIKKSLRGGSGFSDWAVLYRTNAQSLCFEKEFLHRKIPYKVVGSLKFYEREEIKDTLAYLALCANPRDEIAFRRVVNKPSRGIGEKTQDRIVGAAREEDGTTGSLVDAAESLAGAFPKKARTGTEEFCRIMKEIREGFSAGGGLSDFIRRVIAATGLDEYHRSKDEIDGTQRAANLQELVNSAVVYECSPDGLTAFLDAINLDRSLEIQEGEASSDCVTLITVHNTKGLEFRKVVITGLEEGVFPRQDKTGADLEEERRLFYVGITRAQDELYVTSAAKRCLYGAWQYMKPSRFLGEAASAFSVIGARPAGFFCSASGAETGADGRKSASGDVYGEKAEIAGKWRRGTKIYSDDWGYGIISKSYMRDGEFVIEVQFETGAAKKFLPEYQGNSLMAVRD